MKKNVDTIVKTALDTDDDEVTVRINGIDTKVFIFRKKKGLLLIADLTIPVLDEWLCSAKLEVNKINRDHLGKMRVCVGDYLDIVRVEAYADKKKESVIEAAESLVDFIQSNRDELAEMFRTATS